PAEGVRVLLAGIDHHRERGGQRLVGAAAAWHGPSFASEGGGPASLRGNKSPAAGPVAPPPRAPPPAPLPGHGPRPQHHSLAKPTPSPPSKGPRCGATPRSPPAVRSSPPWRRSVIHPRPAGEAQDTPPQAPPRHG